MISWVVATAYLRRFEVLLRWLPIEPYDWVHQFIVMSPDFVEARNLIREVRPAWFSTAVIFPAHELVDYPEYETRGGGYSSAREKLGHKVSAPYYAKPGYGMFYTDDDVIPTRDPEPLLGHTARHSWVGTSRMTDRPQDVAVREALGSLGITPTYSADEWNARRTDGGAFYVPAEMWYPDTYTDIVSECFGALSQLDLAGHRARMADQFTMTTYLNALGSERFRNSEYRVLTNASLGKLPDATLVHYAVHAKDKQKFEDWLYEAAP